MKLSPSPFQRLELFAINLQGASLDAWKIMSLIRKMGKSEYLQPKFATISGLALQLRRTIHFNLRKGSTINRRKNEKNRRSDRFKSQDVLI